ncbi:hypothetical protein [Cellulosimicrobium sp. TH-20]|uniref:hypothetical protein n=1 Tax=Cellulosimicrobium sp. TH-20 TaxID=1980001 RepID=UPI0011A706B7|nr:hypothetical protein [Cellulosimicrobium sp. TH-20]
MSPEEVAARVAARTDDTLADAVAWAAYAAMAEAPRAERPAILHAFAEFSRASESALEALGAPA